MPTSKAVLLLTLTLASSWAVALPATRGMNTDIDPITSPGPVGGHTHSPPKKRETTDPIQSLDPIHKLPIVSSGHPSLNPRNPYEQNDEDISASPGLQFEVTSPSKSDTGDDNPPEKRWDNVEEFVDHAYDPAQATTQYLAIVTAAPDSTNGPLGKRQIIIGHTHFSTTLRAAVATAAPGSADGWLEKLQNGIVKGHTRISINPKRAGATATPDFINSWDEVSLGKHEDGNGDKTGSGVHGDAEDSNPVISPRVDSGDPLGKWNDDADMLGSFGKRQGNSDCTLSTCD
ncbi:hypothetical protein EV356DRAFT_527656 [Viridothelium virens]|uniref:Uncharacterized protein n=1 Tax=Viridothelium virens TaxID=1048519 RepID=A0A6A6HPS5_VIRVR|nr:hypothetical protein EV356DRAFT_527656 [Viridothelium virens]